MKLLCMLILLTSLCSSALSATEATPTPSKVKRQYQFGGRTGGQYLSRFVGDEARRNADANAQIIDQVDQKDSNGNYNYAFKTTNGIEARQTSYMVNGNRVTVGYYSYIGPDGQPYTVHYIADKDGYRASGSHLPVQPGEAIQPISAANIGFPSSTPAPIFSSTPFPSTAGPFSPTPSSFYVPSSSSPFRPVQSINYGFPTSTPAPFPSSTPFPSPTGQYSQSPSPFYVPSSTTSYRPIQSSINYGYPTTTPAPFDSSTPFATTSGPFSPSPSPFYPSSPTSYRPNQSTINYEYPSSTPAPFISSTPYPLQQGSFSSSPYGVPSSTQSSYRPYVPYPSNAPFPIYTQSQPPWSGYRYNNPRLNSSPYSNVIRQNGAPVYYSPSTSSPLPNRYSFAVAQPSTINARISTTLAPPSSNEFNSFSTTARSPYDDGRRQQSNEYIPPVPIVASTPRPFSNNYNQQDTVYITPKPIFNQQGFPLPNSLALNQDLLPPNLTVGPLNATPSQNFYRENIDSINNNNGQGSGRVRPLPASVAPLTVTNLHYR